MTDKLDNLYTRPGSKKSMFQTYNQKSAVEFQRDRRSNITVAGQMFLFALSIWLGAVIGAYIYTVFGFVFITTNTASGNPELTFGGILIVLFATVMSGAALLSGLLALVGIRQPAYYLLYKWNRKTKKSEND